jgi:hypothetical protein
MSKIVVNYNASIGVNDKPAGIRQRIGAVLIRIAQRSDKSRFYFSVELSSEPVMTAHQHAECLKKGLLEAQRFLHTEAREAAGEIAMRAAMPDLFKSEKTRG